ncbi:MAG: hypothetical protein EON58_17490 [Alphaproteobacteria bacterium]|nr:MAG: hypothetical protein EON58_17490 [Alphaproteobacteria bacterium]
MAKLVQISSRIRVGLKVEHELEVGDIIVVAGRDHYTCWNPRYDAPGRHKGAHLDTSAPQLFR